MVLCKVIGRLTTKGLQLLSISSANTPDILHRQPFQCRNAVFVIVDDATVPIRLEFLCQLRCNLCQCLVRREPNGNGHSHLFLDSLMQMLAPLLQVEVLHPVKIHKALVNGISEIARSLLADNAHNPCRQLTV